ncbi:MAG: hypothetical protein IKY83_03270 [Proteobacteria bacterium]|nr:hypothetical protein [Pseudomonadota bacterium]
MKYIINIAMILLLSITAIAMPLDASAQGTQTETLSLNITDTQVEEWMGRESRLSHPVMDGLEKRDLSTLHFYFSKEYGQRAEAVMATAQKAREKNMRFLPAETLEDVNIYLIGNINMYFDALGSKGRAPDWAAGLTILRDGVILIRLAPNGTSKIEPEMTLAHELNHVALRRFAQNNEFPHWFYEGLAMTATEDWNINRAETLAKAAMAGQLLDLAAIDNAFGKIGTIVDLAYAESAHFVSWLAKENGDDAVKKLIADVATGTPFDKAFIQTFGRSPEAAFSVWHQNMSRGENLLASIFSHDGLFFMISVFAAFGLMAALWRKSAVRKARMNAMNQDISEAVLPGNLKSFGPFRS